MTTSQSNKHTHFPNVEKASTPANSLGYLPPVPSSSKGTTDSKKGGFLHKYNENYSKKPLDAKNLVPPNSGFSATHSNITSTKSTKTAKSNNPYACCFTMPEGLEQCPPLNFQDICDNCCSPQRPICSDDPNCHMFKDCKQKYTYGETCKYLRNRGPRIPSWLAHCGRVLTFNAYFQEPVPESDKENYRIRQVNIRYYMDDGTVDVFEPKTFDPGFTQGRLIRRHRIPLPPPADSEFYTMEHFNVGCEVEMYGKTFLICGCNEPTRKYLNKLGISVPQNMTMPEDIYTNWRKDRITSLFARKAKIDLDQGKFKNFLLKNRKVLRFWALWDDRCQLDGHLRKFVVHYYLEDDTIEIKEIQFNSRTDVFPTFLSRGKLYKDHKELVTIPGNKEEALLILNTTGGCHNVFMGQTYLEDRLCPGIDEKPYIKDRDLAIGAVLNVYGRAFILTECDEFTKVYYKEKYGIDNFTPLTLTEEETRANELPRMKTPPHIGIGDEEDTRKNWDKIEIHPPKRDELRLLTMEKDILGFDAQLYETQQSVNGDRRFIINYFMADNTVKIFEKPHPNTGMKPGTFLQRSKPRKSETGIAPRFELGEELEYYQTCDFYVGNILNINGFQFLLTSADPLTFAYMERNTHMFPQSNLCLILDKVREAFGPMQSSDVLELFSEKDSCLNGVIGADDFRDLLMQLVKCSLSEHEMITIVRAFKIDAEEPGPDMNTLQSLIQTELNRRGYDRYHLQRIEDTLRYHDSCGAGVLDRHTLRSSLIAARMPVERYLISFLVDKFEAADNCDRVDYCKVMEFLDYVKHPAPKANPTNIACIMKWLEPKRPSEIFCVNYRAFLETVCPNFVCSLPENCCPSPPPLCCEDPCSVGERPQQTEQIPSDDCCPRYEIDERCLAGKVITDNLPWNEKDRCDTQDYCQFQMTMDPYALPDLQRPVPAYIDPELEAAYQQPIPSDCDSPESGKPELFRCGDYIGFEDVYKKRHNSNNMRTLC